MRQGGNELGPHDGLNPRGGKDAVVILLLKTGYSICNLDYVVENYKVPYWNETTYERLRFANDKAKKRTYTDSSFAPSSGKSHGSVAKFFGTCPGNHALPSQPQKRS